MTRARGQTNKLESLLVALEAFAYYCNETGGFRARANGQRGPRYYHAHDRLGTPNSKGYLLLRVQGAHYRVSRLVWLWHTGNWPVNQADHYPNSCRTDNRIENLRDVTNSVNGKNRKKSIANISGCTNVYWESQRQKWVVMFQINGGSKRVGSFGSFEEAVVCRNNYLIDNPHGFTTRHGQ